jgi:hypothetical protein
MKRRKKNGVKLERRRIYEGRIRRMKEGKRME